jgi:hypothetical protein
MDGSAVPYVGWHFNLYGYTRYISDNGLLLNQGWHYLDGSDRYILSGSVPASGWVEVDGVMMLFDDLGLRLE